jgi:hypothetical protein
MMSLLGSEMNFKGYIFKPFYLILGVLYFVTLLMLLGSLYVILYLRNTLEIVLKDLEKNRKKYSNLK